MKQKIFAMFTVAVLLLGMSACADLSDNPAVPSQQEMEQRLVGLWWEEYECDGVTESGVPFNKALLAIKTNADHTGCIYLGVFDGTSSEPLAVYGGPEDGAFTWSMLADGSVVLSDPVTGEIVTQAPTRGADGSSYGNGMTNLGSTNVTYTDGGMQVTNGNYSGTLAKADAEKQAEIEKMLSTLSPDRQNFEAELSQMLADAQKYVKLDPTIKAVNLLTEFINQLKIDALQPQITKIVLSMLSNGALVDNPSLTAPEAEEVRWAVANSNFASENSPTYILLNAYNALRNTALEFTTGKDTAQYVTTNDDAFTVSCKNATSGAVTKVRMRFSGKDDGVAIPLAKLGIVPVVIQFPHMIDLELLRSESGNDADAETVMTGQVMLESTDGKKYISLKHSGWRATLLTEAKKNNRFEVPACELIHHANHTIEGNASLSINGTTIMTIKGHNDDNPYSDEELEQLRELRDIAPMGKGLYTLLKAFNSRTAKAEVTLMNDLVFDIDILDVGKGIKAVGNAMKYRHEEFPKETIDPWTGMLNESLTYTVTQKATGVKADGKFITSLIAGRNLPSFALRFKGESDFRAIHDRMNSTDRQNYETMLKSLNESLTALNALLKAVQDKGVEINALIGKKN